MFRKKKKEPQHLVVEVSSADNKKPSEGEVRAQRFVLTDSEGNTRAQLQCVDGGAVALTFHNDKGKMAMLLGLDPDQDPTFAFIKDGKKKASFELDKQTSQPSLSLHGSEKSKVEIGFDKTDNASVRLCDNEGSVRLSISLSAKGDAQVKLFDKKGYIQNELKPK